MPLRRVEARDDFETARRPRAVIGQVFRLAIATARAENDPTFGLKSALTTPKMTHRAALTDRKAFAGLNRAVWTYEGAPDTRMAEPCARCTSTNLRRICVMQATSRMVPDR